jgi:hypothetical protein
MILKLEPHDKQRLLSVLDECRKIIEGLDSRRACTTCIYLRQGLCEKWQAKPPLEYIKVGCESWEFDEDSPPF